MESPRHEAHDIREDPKPEFTRDFLQALIESNEGTLVVDSQGIIQYASQQILGFIPEEILGKTLRHLFHPDDVAAPGPYVGDVPTNPGESASSRRRFRHKEGHCVPLRVRTTNLLSHPSVRGLVVSLVKEPELDDALTALRRSQETLLHAQRVARIGNWDWHLADNRLEWTREIYRIFGLNPRAFGATYEAFLERVHPDDRERVEAAVAAALQGAHYSIDHRIVTPEGEQKLVHEDGEVTFDTSGKPVRMLGTVQDVTERARMQKAEAANEAKNKFLAKVSHELRTPLNAIMGLTDLLCDTELSRSQRADLEQINRSAESLLRLVSDVLDLSHMEAGQIELAARPFDLRVLVEDSVQPLIRRAQDKGLEMLCHIVPDVPNALIGDAGRLQQVLINLISNAIKFTSRGDVKVEVKRSSQRHGHVCLEFSVCDTGPGIRLEQREEIFELFVRGEAGAMHPEGVGLGLTTAAQLVHMMGGKIQVDSEFGKGSRFCFTVELPIDQDAPAQEVGASQLEGTRVLVIDGNAKNRQTLTEITGIWSMLPTAVSDGSTGLEHLRAAVSQGQPFQLLLLDSKLPDSGGLELARVIRDDVSLPGVPTILMSMNLDDKELEEVLALGDIVRMTKPISPSKVLEAIELALRIKVPADLSPVSRPAPRAALRVLLAEDNPVNQVVTRRMLEELGHQVHTVANGQDAVEALEHDKFDVVLMDYEMPVMDGLEATKRIRAREEKLGQHRPLIALTAYAMAEDRDRLLNAGMDGYLAKPLRMDALADALHDVASAEPVAKSTSGAAKGRRVISQASSASEGEVLDMSKLPQGQSPDSILGLIEMLEQQLLTLDASMAAAINDGDVAALRVAAHTLKGSLLLFGAKQASTATRRLEEMGRAGELEGAEAALVDLEARILDLRLALEPLKLKLATEQVELEAPGHSSPVGRERKC